MKYEVFLSEQAAQDVRNIYEYIAIEKQAPEVARALVLRIEEQILRLDEMPYRFSEYENEPWKSRGMRIMPVENFLVCYIPIEQYRTVNIVSLFHSEQNIEKQLKKTK